MITRHEVLISLYGAWRLLIRDPRGVEWMDDSIEGYWNSFFCAVVVLPGYALLFFFSAYDAFEVAGFFRFFAVGLIGYVIGWVVWPLIMVYVAAAFDRDSQYFRYIVAYNWSAGIAVAIFLIVLFVRLLGFLPEGIMAFVSFIALVVVLVYHWFIARLCLEITSGTAAALVAGDFVLGQIISKISLNMLQ